MITTNRLKRVLSRMRFEVRQVPIDLGRNPWRDMKRWVTTEQPIIFDVGANQGQTVQTARRHFPQCELHSFEPSPTTFNLLKQNVGRLEGVNINNIGLAAKAATMDFFEYSADDMSSMLPSGSENWAQVKNVIPVPVESVDSYCQAKGIEQIDILKSDTQGFDLEVLKGAESMLRDSRIQLIFMEIIFNDLYKDLPSLDEIYRFLSERGFILVSFYKMYYRQNRAAWTDALFVNPGFATANHGRRPCGTRA